MMADKATEAQEPTAKKASGRQPQARLSQSDVPAFTLDEAMRVAEALRDDWAKKSATPLNLASSLGLSPSSSRYRMLTGAAVAYGLTEGAAKSSEIVLTDLGRRCVAPTEEGDDLVARQEAALRPRVIREFLEKYDGSPLPQESIARNVIETFNVPGDAVSRAYEMIIANAEAMGFFLEIKGKRYVQLNGAHPAGAALGTPDGDVLTDSGDAGDAGDYAPDEVPAPARQSIDATPVNNRVFITHGKNATVVEQIQKILRYGKFEPVVSAQLQTVAKPVPDKVMDDMRSCSAAIVHVGIERMLIDETGKQFPQINGNVLIEIGAAMALYNRRFVLLVERGVELPSNLQGLYEVRYEGEQLEFDATMKLLEVFSSF